MYRYLILTALLSLATGSHVLGQKAPDKQEAEKDKTETIKAVDESAPAVKVVPAAKSKHAKPARVSSAKPRNTRPATRPARNPRPSGRPARPGNGRN